MQNPPYDPSAGIATSPDGPPVNENWQARRELAAALRGLNCALLTSNTPTDQLRAATAAVQAQTQRVQANERLFGRKAHAEHVAAQQNGQLPPMGYEMSPVHGLSNAVAPPLRIWQADGQVHAEVTPGWAQEGPFGHLHGGVIALLFDELLGTGVLVSGGGARTGTLTIRYHHLTPLHKTLRMTCRVVRVEGRKKFLEGELWADELRTASCEGIFIGPKT